MYKKRLIKAYKKHQKQTYELVMFDHKGNFEKVVLAHSDELMVKSFADNLKRFLKICELEDQITVLFGETERKEFKSNFFELPKYQNLEDD